MKAVASKVADDTIIRNEGRFRHTLWAGLALGGKSTGKRSKLFQNGEKQVGVNATFMGLINLEENCIRREQWHEGYTYHNYTKAAQQRV